MVGGGGRGGNQEAILGSDSRAGGSGMTVIRTSTVEHEVLLMEPVSSVCGREHGCVGHFMGGTPPTPGLEASCSLSGQVADGSPCP